MIATRLKQADELFLCDETAWLDAMAMLASDGRVAELDCKNLAEYLADMAKRDRREVESRLALLISHMLKWEHQLDKRSRSWLLTIELQQQELRRLFASGTLRNHAEAVMSQVYADGIRQASIETGITASAFPTDCPYAVGSLENDLPIGDPVDDE
jgi:hypothetical protein